MFRNLYTEESVCATLSQNLVYLRKSRKPGVSQKTVARLLHLPEKTVMNYENGYTVPTAYAVLCLADYYGCTVEELMTQNMQKKEGKIT